MGRSAQPCLLWHLRCCLLQQHIFHPCQQYHQLHSLNLSLPHLLFVAHGANVKNTHISLIFFSFFLFTLIFSVCFIMRCFFFLIRFFIVVIINCLVSSSHISFYILIWLHQCFVFFLFSFSSKFTFPVYAGPNKPFSFSGGGTWKPMYSQVSGTDLEWTWLNFSAGQMKKKKNVQCRNYLFFISSLFQEFLHHSRFYIWKSSSLSHDR